MIAYIIFDGKYCFEGSLYSVFVNYYILIHLEEIKMALEKCPHMNAHCPHFKNECADDESSSCHYVKNTITNSIVSLLAFRGFDQEGQSGKMRYHIDETEEFLADLGLILE